MATTAASASPAAKSESPTLVRGLSLLDTVLLLVGGVIGSSIFLTAKDIAGPLPHPVLFLLVWVIGGVVSLFACFAFSELGTMFPRRRRSVCLHARGLWRSARVPLWLDDVHGRQLRINRRSGRRIGSLSRRHCPDHLAAHVVLSLAGFTLTRAQVVALIMIAGVTWINIVGLRRGACCRTSLPGPSLARSPRSSFSDSPLAKGTGTILPRVPHSLTLGASSGQLLSAFGVALIAVFWAYDGWVYIGWVAGEMKDPRRTVPRALILGIAIVGVLYVAMNVAYLYALPIDQIAQHETIAHAAAIALFSPAAATWLSAMVSLSIFGALACAILAAPRIYYAMAVDGLFFRSMAKVHPKWRTPAFALIGQAIWSAILTLSGRYDQLYTYVMFGMVLSYTMTVVGLFVLRRTRPDIPRPYRCTGYPWLPAIYVIVGTAWTLNTIFTRPHETLAGAAIVLVGVPGYLYWKRSAKSAA